MNITRWLSLVRINSKFLQLVKMGSNLDWEVVLIAASRVGNLEYVEMSISHGAKNLDEAMENACMNCSVYVIMYLGSKGVVTCIHCKKSIPEHVILL